MMAEEGIEMSDTISSTSNPTETQTSDAKEADDVTPTAGTEGTTSASEGTPEAKPEAKGKGQNEPIVASNIPIKNFITPLATQPKPQQTEAKPKPQMQPLPNTENDALIKLLIKLLLTNINKKNDLVPQQQSQQAMPRGCGRQR